MVLVRCAGGRRMSVCVCMCVWRREDRVLVWCVCGRRV